MHTIFQKYNHLQNNIFYFKVQLCATYILTLAAPLLQGLSVYFFLGFPLKKKYFTILQTQNSTSPFIAEVVRPLT